jgi:hypothetical protein
MLAYLFVSFWVARHDVFVAVVVVCCEGEVRRCGVVRIQSPTVQKF